MINNYNIVADDKLINNKSYVGVRKNHNLTIKIDNNLIKNDKNPLPR